jgi:hypothetical protein
MVLASGIFLRIPELLLFPYRKMADWQLIHYKNFSLSSDYLRNSKSFLLLRRGISFCLGASRPIASFYGCNYRILTSVRVGATFFFGRITCGSAHIRTPCISRLSRKKPKK